MTKTGRVPPALESMQEALRAQGWDIVPMVERSDLVDRATALMAVLKGVGVPDKRAALRLALRWLGEQSRIGRKRIDPKEAGR